MFSNTQKERLLLLFRISSQWCQINVNLNEAQATGQSINSDEHVDTETDEPSDKHRVQIKTK